MSRSDEARKAVLGSISANLTRARNEVGPASAPAAAAAASVELEPRREELIEGFKRVLESVGGGFVRVSNKGGAARALGAMMVEQGARRAAISDAPMIRSLVADFEIEIVEHDADRETLLDSDIGISSAQWAVAETGTVVLESSEERHRLVSLIPPVHIVIVEASKLLPRLGDLLTAIGHDGPESMSRAVTFITGPSRTADIELTPGGRRARPQGVARHPHGEGLK